MEFGLGVTQEKKPRSYTMMISEALERGEDPANIEQQVMAEAEAEEKESPFQAETPDEMLAERQAEESSLEGQIRSKEDEMGTSRAGLERGLLGAIQTIGSSSIRRQGGDATAFDRGMANAQKLAQDPMEAAEQRRAFLKERLGRTDVPYRTKTDDLILRQRERGERIGGATEEDKIAQEKMDTGLKSADLTLKSNMAQLSNKRVDATSDLSAAARAREVAKLKRTAMQIGRTDPGTAKSLMDMASNLETNQNLSEQELSLLEDMKFTPPDDQTLEWFKARTARENAQRVRVGAEDKDLKELAKRVGPETAVDNAFAELEAKIGPLEDPKTAEKDLPGTSVPGIGRVSFYSQDAREIDAAVQAITGPLSTARYGASQTNTELRKLATELAEGKFNTESEKVKALARLKDLNRQAIAEDKAGFRPETVELYESRRAAEREKLGQTSTETPAIVTDPNDL